ncbi:VWA domain-containing protein [Cohnella sp.]|uniref:vWA domain-containing protein n=1 Tax=Cohnella sp. TaxID=1883426 RepID=UPI003704328E
MSNSTKLITGSNAPLPNESLLELTVEWTSSPAELDVSCFMVNEQGKVPSDHYFIFYNQAEDPGRHVRFEPQNPTSVKFTIDLNGLMSSPIQKCVFAATLDGPGTFSEVQGCKITANVSGSEIAYDCNEGKAEKTLVLVELYRHGGWFKLRAIGRGFNGGLKPLAESHGVVVDEPETEATPEVAASSSASPSAQTSSPTPVADPAPVQSNPPETKVNLTKIDLLKKKVQISLEKKRMDTIKARVAVVFDASGSMMSLYQKGTVQRAFEKVLAIAACMDDDGVMDVWFFGSKSKRTPSVTENDYEDYVKKTYPSPRVFGGLGAGNNEPVVMADVIKKYTKEEPSDVLPTYVIFFSDGGIYETKKISKLLIESSKTSIFWQFVGLGNASFGVLEELDNLQGRFIDNADFFALSDLDKVTDEELYDRIFNEFPGWHRQAKEKGILR